MRELSGDVRLIEAGRPDAGYWRELWAYRELFLVLAWRDLAARYRHTLAGVLWAVLRPLVGMGIFTFVFDRLAGLPSEGQVPYPLLVLAGMLPWFLFSTALGSAAESVTGSAALIGKVYFPRAIVPVATMVVALTEFLLGLAVLALWMAAYGVAPGFRVLLLPAFIGLAMLASLGLGLWMAALNAKYRDFRFITPFLLQAGLYVSPVGFSSAVVPEAWRLLYSLNPMVGVIDGFRWCLLGGDRPLYLPGVALSATVGAVLLWIGLARFRAAERGFADVL